MANDDSNPTTPVTPDTGSNPPAEPPATDPQDDGLPKEPDARPKDDINVEVPEDVDLLDPKKAKEFVTSAVKTAMGTVTEKVEKQQIERELESEFAAHPEYKPYEARIRAWVTHPNRAGMIKQGLPVRAVVIEAIAPHLERIGAEKARAADKAAAATASSGTTGAPTTPTTPDFKAMSNAEISNMAELVKSGRYKP